MPHAHEIRGRALAFGHDQRLLITRAQLLQADGYRTEITNDFEGLQKFLAQSETYDVIVVCHTVSDFDQQRTVQELQRRQLAIPVYTMSTSAFPSDFLNAIGRLTNMQTLVREA